MGYRFRLTFHHSSPGFFRFDKQSVAVTIGDGLKLDLTARDADSLIAATRFHFEGSGFSTEADARLVGERLRLRLRVLNSMLGLGLTIPLVDLRRQNVADAVRDKVHSETGGIIVDSIDGMGIMPEDPSHFEHIAAGKGSVFPSEPDYLFNAISVMWPLEIKLDDRAEDALQILNMATAERSPRAKFLITYLALEQMIDRLPRSEAAQKLIEDCQKQVQNSSLDDRDKESLMSSLESLREQSPRTALLNLVDRIKPPPMINGVQGRKFLSQCVNIRNSIAHNANIDPQIDLVDTSKGLTHFVMSLIWMMNNVPDVTVHVPASTVQLDFLKIRLL